MSAKVLSFLRANVGSFRGLGYIAGEPPDGIVTVEGAPAVRSLECRHRQSRRVMQLTMSNPDGTYRFDNLDPLEEYDIIGRDFNREFSDVIIPAVKPVPYT